MTTDTIIKKILYNNCNRNILIEKIKIPLGHNSIISLSFLETKYSDYGCFGFVKISKEVQQNVILPFNKWNNLDSIFYELFIRKYGLKKVHNHKEVSHLHIY